ncbi:MAG: DNA-binding response regulator, partial [Actinomycetota bacterium]
MRLLLLTQAVEPSAEVLPALSLLSHSVRILPAQATALLDAPPADVVLIDGRRDLPQVRSLTRLIRQTGVEIPVLLIVTEGGLTALQTDWGVDEFVLHTCGPAEVEARLRLAVARLGSAADAGASAEIR